MDNWKQLYIDGTFRPASGGATLEVVDPSDGKPCDEIASAGAQDVETAVAAARKAVAGEWREWTPVRRAAVLMGIASAIREATPVLAPLLRQENGKIAAAANAEVESAARYIEYYAGLADKIHGSVIDLGFCTTDFVRREPLGVTGHIVPWNYPLDVFCRSVGPALAAGNTCIVKPAPETARATLAMTRVFHQADLPLGVLNVLPGDGSTAGASLAAHPGLDGIVFTGSVETGRQVLVAAAGNITPVISVELGSKCPAIIFPGMDRLDSAVADCMGSLVWNCGQSCGQRSRLYVHESVYDEFVRKLSDAACAIRIVDPRTDDAFGLGPLASRKQYEKVLRYLEIARREGAELACGGDVAEPIPGVPEGGYFLRPVVLSNCRHEMQVCREEVFGPVVCVIRVSSFDEALKLANDSPYGLSAAVWTDRLDYEHRSIRELNVGHLTINGSAAFGFEVPFGGVKQSGYGREGGLGATYAYTREKNVWINA